MKTYIFTYERKKNNDVNGNPRHWVTVYRIKRNEPTQLARREKVGYRSKLQAVCDVISEAELWGLKDHRYESGFSENGVARAYHNGDIRIIEV